ncbi:MAG TPA: hypothetical protein VF746_29990 [Longimicrobium sp.]|jgi:hypothetical protein
MRKKLSLDLEALAVDSFATSKGDGEKGTVRAHDEDMDAPACTCQGTCLCPTAYYHCGTGPFTIYSCEYTNNRSCLA